jgi:thiol-disulfide isomerase/thioredoxin
MNPVTILGMLAGLLAIATVIGLLWRRSIGRVHQIASESTVISIDELDADAVAGNGATLLQFSTEVCAPCRSAHRVLGELAEQVEGVTHVDVDVTRRPDLANRFNLLQSPTTLILDGRGVVRARIGGAPRPADVRVELDRILAAA